MQAFLDVRAVQRVHEYTRHPYSCHPCRCPPAARVPDVRLISPPRHFDGGCSTARDLPLDSRDAVEKRSQRKVRQSLFRGMRQIEGRLRVASNPTPTACPMGRRWARKQLLACCTLDAAFPQTGWGRHVTAMSLHLGESETFPFNLVLIQLWSGRWAERGPSA
jgi:hypothetical protein